MSSPGQRLNSIRERLAMLSQIDPSALFTPNQLERRKKLYSYSTPRLEIPLIQRYIKQEEKATNNGEQSVKSKATFNFESIDLPPSEKITLHVGQNQENIFEAEVKPKQAQKNDQKEEILLEEKKVANQAQEGKEHPDPQQKSLNLTVKINTSQTPCKLEPILASTSIQKSKEEAAIQQVDFNSTTLELKAPMPQKKQAFKLGQLKKTTSFECYPQQKKLLFEKKLQFNHAPQKTSHTQDVKAEIGSTNNLFSGARIHIIENTNHRISSSQIIQPQNLLIKTQGSLLSDSQSNQKKILQEESVAKPINLTGVLYGESKKQIQLPVPEKKLNFFTKANTQQDQANSVPITNRPAINYFKKDIFDERKNVSKIMPNQVKLEYLNNTNIKSEQRKEDRKDIEQIAQPNPINIFSRMLPEPKKEIRISPYETQQNIFKPKEPSQTNIFKRQAPITNIFKTSSTAPANIFTKQSTPLCTPSNQISQPQTKSERISNIFSHDQKTNIVSKSQQIGKTTNIFGQKFSQNEATAQEGEEDANSENEGFEQEEDKFDPTLSTGSYNYVSTNVIFKATAAKCKIQNGQLIENVVFSLEKFEKPDVYLYIRMSNKCIKLCSKIVRGVTSISKIGQNCRNIVMSRLLNLQNANPVQPKLTTIKLQFLDEETGALLMTKGQQCLQKLKLQSQNRN